MSKGNGTDGAKSATQEANNRPVLVLAVHGIGDQVRNATVQQVAVQFCRYFGKREIIPLGEFDGNRVQREFQTRGEQFVKGGTQRTFYFQEAYWADIARTIAGESYTLEETKQWASSVVARLEQRDSKSGVKYPLVRQVIEEMVEAIGVLERLTFLADKAGLVKFELNKVLVDYLDDVQVVTEFDKRRREIVDRFAKALESAPSDVDIYIVAHSEGTVVSFLGLLEAMWAEKTPTWLQQVRGYLTIGSPIDKHLVLWPKLFPEGRPVFEPVKTDSETSGDRRIQWRNYYDYGDPVGFELDEARRWLGAEDRRVAAFEFDGKSEKAPDPEHDNGFARYCLPGKAHNDYWADSAVFDHFIGSVIDMPAKPIPKPSDRFWPRPVAYLVSYGLVFLLLFAGIFFSMRSVSSFNQEANLAALNAQGAANAPFATNAHPLSGLELMRDSAGIAFLLVGMTVLARVPRLVDPRLSSKWLWIALGIFATLASLFCQVTSEASRKAMARLPSWALAIEDATELTVITVGLALVIALIAAWTGRKRDVGSKPLLGLAGSTAVTMVLLLLKRDGSSQPSLWPVVLALAGFLYLWWVAILLFDLVFIWHRYIRFGVGPDRLEENCGLKGVGGQRQ